MNIVFWIVGSLIGIFLFVLLFGGVFVFALRLIERFEEWLDDKMLARKRRMRVAK